MSKTKNLSPETNQVVDLYKGEELKRISLPEEEYGVCSDCGFALGRCDVGSVHSVCEQSMFMGNTQSDFLGNMDTNDLFC